MNKIKNKIAGLGLALVLGTGVAVTAPVVNNDTAEAAVGVHIQRMYNWRYSDKGTYVFTGRSGKGFFKFIKPGEVVRTIEGQLIESVAIPARCQGILDPVIGTRTVVDNRRGSSAIKYNFPARFLSQSVVLELHCIN